MAAINSANHGTIDDVLDAAYADTVAKLGDRIYDVLVDESFGLSCAALMTCFISGYEELAQEHQINVPLEVAILLQMMGQQIQHIRVAFGDTLFGQQKLQREQQEDT